VVNAAEPVPASAAKQLLVVSGLSGSGKTGALATLEDQNWFCVDNLPAGLLGAFAAQTMPSAFYPCIAIGIDARNRPEDLHQLPHALSALAESGVTPSVLFLECSDDVLVKRYSETRRPHPLSRGGLSLREAIASERRLLKPLRELADHVIDTSELNVHQLRRRLTIELQLAQGQLSLLFESFAFKRGVPNDADFVFDARSLPNPHWEPRLRPLSGRDQAVRDYFAATPEMERYVVDVRDFLTRWLPNPEATDRAYLTVAIGCTGGRHRSVYIVEQLAEHFRSRLGQVLSFHRELG
jgi:UPF0042 nucleotide-binding protein